MKPTALFILFLLLAPTAAALQVGDQAPDFLLEATDGKTYSLSQFRGKEAVGIAWHPMAFTRGCTIECKSLAENGHLLKRFEVAYFMASVDSLKKTRALPKRPRPTSPCSATPPKRQQKIMTYWPSTESPSDTLSILARMARSCLLTKISAPPQPPRIWRLRLKLGPKRDQSALTAVR